MWIWFMQLAIKVGGVILGTLVALVLISLNSNKKTPIKKTSMLAIGFAVLVSSIFAYIAGYYINSFVIISTLAATILNGFLGAVGGILIAWYAIALWKEY